METEKNEIYRHSKNSLFKYLVTFILIAIGVLMFAQNAGYITYELYDIIVSWSSLLIIGGLLMIIKQNFFTGGVITLWGVHMLLSKIPEVPVEAQQMIWPAIFILGGIYFFFHTRKEHFHHHHFHKSGYTKWNRKYGNKKVEDAETKDGYLKSDNSFGSVKHVVLDEVFKGGDIDVSFGGTTIDLRRTTLQEGGSTINIDCSFSGVELYIPSDWKVVNKCNVFFGGCDDKRYGVIDSNKVLTIRGDISFGGLEIKGLQMNIHPIIYYPSRWITVLAVTLIASILYAILISFTYTISLEYALADCMTSAILIDLIAYPLWYLLIFINGYISQSIVIIIQTVLWICGCFVINGVLISNISDNQPSFINTLPIRIPLALSLFWAILLWYRNIAQEENYEQLIDKEAVNCSQDDNTKTDVIETEHDDDEILETVTVKNKNKITIIKIEDIIYITACGDYVSIQTKDGEFIKEQTMKYFQTHLPSASFLRIHRSTIVNTMHISGLELYGKESYSLLMKDGKSLKVSLSGYKLLKEKLNL